MKRGVRIGYSANSYEDWALGYHIGNIGKALGSDYDNRRINHFCHYTLKNEGASVRVVATDQFESVYEQDYITWGDPVDYPSYE